MIKLSPKYNDQITPVSRYNIHKLFRASIIKFLVYEIGRESLIKIRHARSPVDPTEIIHTTIFKYSMYKEDHDCIGFIIIR